MELFVDRNPSQPDWTLSKFYSSERSVQGVGVEDEKRAVKQKGETCISVGTYNLGLRYSPKFSKSYYRDDEGNLIAAKDRITVEQMRKYHTQHEMIWVMDVSNFEFILWHWGNTDDHTDGCYIVGSTYGAFGTQKGVSGSRAKYMEIYPIIFRAIKAGKATVTYREIN